MFGLAEFQGDWSIDRRIEDRLAGAMGRFVGVARFAKSGTDVLEYEETGELTLGAGPSFAARRAYRWVFEPGQVRVLFEDGRPFHSFVPTGAAAGTDHPCGADLYRVHYDFTPWPGWTAEWQVSGPRKDYTMRSIYRRA